MYDPARFDLDALEFKAVRELLLERLTTTLGRRDVETLGPLSSPGEANDALRVAAELARDAGRGERPPVGGAVEVRSWLPGFFSGSHQPDVRDLAALKRLLRAAARCRAWLVGRPDAAALSQMAMRFPLVSDIADELERVVDDRGEVLSTASVRLAEIRQEIELADAAVRGAVTRFLSDERVRRCLQSSEPAWRHGRPTFAVRFELRHQVAGVLHDRSQSGATVFIEPEVVVEAANRLADAHADEHREIQVVLTHVCRGLRHVRADVEGAVASMGALDLAMARSALIERDGFHAIPVAAGASLKLRGALHPLLLLAASARDGRRGLVPLDLSLGDVHRILVVTGPNTGGKTVAMKTVGLLTSMAMAGVPIPADPGSSVPFVDGIFADIGDEQAIAQNLSTFSSHVKRIARCITDSTERSLVLLDELGAGTDPEEGSTLGTAVLEALERRGVIAVVTTHLGRLKDFAYQHATAENGAMAFDGASLRPLFRLEIGIPGASHAHDIAGRVGMPADVVRRARELLGTRDERLERMIEQIQVARQKAEEERRRTEDLKQEAESVGREIAEKRQQMDARRAWLEEEADAALDEQVKSIRSRLEAPLRSLANAPRPFGDEARQLLADLARMTEGTTLHRRRMRFCGGLKKDDVVFLSRLRKRCTVKKVDRVREILTLDAGKMRLEVPFEDVSWIQPLDA